MKISLKKQGLYSRIRRILELARSRVARVINTEMVAAYWLIGREILEEEQKGKWRADYGEGFSEQSLRNMRQFYKLFKIRSTLWSELSWSHYKLLIRVESLPARRFYGKEAAEGRWSVRALERQIHSHYYERLLSSRNRGPILNEARKKVLRLKAGNRTPSAGRG